MRIGQNKATAVAVLLIGLVLWALGQLWEIVLRPIVALNIEQWAAKHGYDQTLNLVLETPGVGHVMTAAAEAASAVYGVLASWYALAFILGCLFIAFSDWIVWPFKAISARIGSCKGGHAANDAGSLPDLAKEAQERAKELVAFAEAKVLPLHHLAENVAINLVSQGVRPAQPGFANVLDSSLTVPLGWARNLLRSAAEAAPGRRAEEMETAVIDQHTMYLHFRGVILLLSGASGFELSRISMYEGWKDADRDYRRRLRELVACGKYQRLREAMERATYGDELP